MPLSLEDEKTRQRVTRKIHRRRKSSHLPAMELPERFQNDNTDAEEDVVPPRQGSGTFLNQSIFGLIAAAGSSADFADRFDGQSSEDDGPESADEAANTRTRKNKHDEPRQDDLAQTTILGKGASEKDKAGKHRRKLSGQLLRSLPQLPRLSSKASKLRPSRLRSQQSVDLGKNQDDASGSSLPAAEPRSPTSPTSQDDEEDDEADGGRLAPIMSRMLEAKAEMASRPSFDIERKSSDLRPDADADVAGPSALASKLKEIFELDHPEEVIQEYPCWYLQSVLLQGYMYITAKHICFYAYLPKKSNEVAKSGFMSKSGKRNPKYNRYWFRLKGDVLAYYRDSSNFYFPNGQIDLRYAISASITDKDKEGMHFTVVTHHRTYHFRADSAPSAAEWVKSLQRVIFRSHNDGDSVKISLPIQNVLDVEDSQMIDFADTCKVRVIDNDETYAIDDYYFSFFSFGKEAINVLKILVEDRPRNLPEQPRTPEGPASPQSPRSARSSRQGTRNQSPAARELSIPKVREHVKATLSPTSAQAHKEPLSPNRSGSDLPHFHLGRRSADLEIRNRETRSFSGSRSRSMSKNKGLDHPADTDKLESSDSLVQSLEDPSGTSAMIDSATDDPSGSQILRGSEVFRSPTVRRSISASSISKKNKPDGAEKSPRQKQDVFPDSHRAHAATTGAIDGSGGTGSSEVPSLQNIVKMGSYPLQRAGYFANYLNQTRNRFGNILATESMGYVEKVSGMWRGGRKHYDEPHGHQLHEDPDDVYEEDDDGQVATANDHFRDHFAVPESEKLKATYFGFLHRVLPLYGKIYLSNRSFCFRSLLPGTRTKLILPLKDIENVDKERGFRFGYSGLVVVIRGHEELFFEFSQAEVRDDCAITLIKSTEAARYLRDSEIIDKEEQELADEAAAERDALQKARLQQNPEHEIKMPTQASGPTDSQPTILFDDPKASFLNFKPSQPMKITCLTIGSRGDVQPYIALCKGLLAEGHHVRIATHLEFQSWVEGHGIEFRPIDGNPAELMRICIENGTFTWAFLKEANSKFRGWLDDLLFSAWKACEGSDLLIESPSAMAGIHIAEALSIPYFRAFTMPWTRTRAYPHAFIYPEHKMGGAYNYITYLMFDNVFWKATASQVNRWRRNVLGLPATNLEKMQPNKVPFLYNFSPAVVAPPLDFSDWIRVTGYWFLDEGGDDWTPPEDLRAFIEQARKDKKPLVYVGFGSIIVPDPAKMTQEVIDAVLKADVRCVLSKGWSDRDDNKDATTPEPELPPEIFQIKSAPHDWLFAQMDAAAHHGGSGTTGASLRAGIPTIIRPFFGDQFFFGGRVEDLGVGISLKKWGTNTFARALWEATHSERMITKARVLGETIRRENGVDTAIQSIYRDLEYATSLVKTKAGKNALAANNGNDQLSDGVQVEEDDDEEESWTFVGGDDVDTDHVVKKSALAALANSPEARSLSLGSRILGGRRRGETLPGDMVSSTTVTTTTTTTSVSASRSNSPVSGS